MIGVTSKLTAPRIRELLAGAGIDLDRARPRPRRQCQGDRRHHRAQRRSGGGLRLQGHAVLHRRQVPGARNPDHGAVRAGDRRRAQGGRAKVATAQQKRPRRGRGRFGLRSQDCRDYFDDSLTQSSCARFFSPFHSVAATSQLTMVRLADARLAVRDASRSTTNRRRRRRRSAAAPPKSFPEKRAWPILQ